MVSKEGKITIKNVPNITELAGEKVMVDFQQGLYFMLKGTGNAIWDLIEDGIAVKTIIEKLTEEYDVSEEECTAATISFLEKLEKFGFIEGTV
ncbi:MAG: PqqD family protein [Lachnospiraceae bacterium]|nr:PqqD family protein [Lachnospiraceae bacterium]